MNKNHVHIQIFGGNSVKNNSVKNKKLKKSMINNSSD